MTKIHDVQSIEIDKPASAVFAFVAKPKNLTVWTNAFKKADGSSAVLETPAGATPIKLKTIKSEAARTVDWRMTFPDGSVGEAFSRVTPLGDDRSVYSFVLMPPPVPLEMLEGALQQQMATLAEELKSLKTVMEQ